MALELRLLQRLGATSALELTADESLLGGVRRAGLPLGQSCRGAGICGSCGLWVVSGAANLTPPTALETSAGAAPRGTGWRLACQAQGLPGASGLVTLWHPSWGHPSPDPGLLV